MGADRPLLPRRARAHQTTGRVYVPRLRRDAAAAPLAVGTGRAPLVPPERNRSIPRADLARVRVLGARLQPLRPARHLRDPEAAARPPVEPPAPGARRARARLQHRG